MKCPNCDFIVDVEDCSYWIVVILDSFEQLTFTTPDDFYEWFEDWFKEHYYNLGILKIEKVYY